MRKVAVVHLVWFLISLKTFTNHFCGQDPSVCAQALLNICIFRLKTNVLLIWVIVIRSKDHLWCEFKCLQSLFRMKVFPVVGCKFSKLLNILIKYNSSGRRYRFWRCIVIYCTTTAFLLLFFLRWQNSFESAHLPGAGNIKVEDGPKAKSWSHNRWAPPSGWLQCSFKSHPSM